MVKFVLSWLVGGFLRTLEGRVVIVRVIVWFSLGIPERSEICRIKSCPGQRGDWEAPRQWAAISLPQRSAAGGPCMRRTLPRAGLAWSAGLRSWKWLPLLHIQPMGVSELASLRPCRQHSWGERRKGLLANDSYVSSHVFLCESQISPNICFASVSFSINDFRAHPVGGAGDRFDPRPGHADGLNALASPKISQLHISSGVPQNVCACEETHVYWITCLHDQWWQLHKIISCWWLLKFETRPFFPRF